MKTENAYDFDRPSGDDVHVGITSLQDIYANHIFSVKLSGQDPDRAHVGDSRHFYWN